MNKQQATFELTPADLTLKHPELGTGPIPTDMYWQPEFYDREMEAIYKRAWLCVGRVEQVKAPGDFFVKEIKTFDMSVIVARAKDDVVRAFYNVCQHRGNRIFDGREGSVAQVVCPYHGWRYALDGTLASVPDAERFVPPVAPAARSLKAVHLDPG